MSYNRIYVYFIVVMLFFAVFAADSCGKRSGIERQLNEAVQTPYGYDGTDNSGAELPPKPEGVDEHVWKAITGEFLRNFPVNRTVSAPPAVAPIPNIEWQGAPGSVLVLRWSYNNFGDYDLNGEVGISDLTPIAVNYLFPAEQNELTMWLDQSGDGEVGIPDVTPIALNYLCTVDGYVIEYSSEQSGGFSEAGRIEFNSDGGIDKTQIPYLFEAQIDSGVPFESWFRVRSYHGETLGPPSASVRISNIPNPGEIVLKETWEGGDGTIENADNVWTVEGPAGDKGFDWAVVSGNPVLGHGPVEGQKFVRWDTGLDSGNVGSNAQRWVKTGPVAIRPETDYRISFYTNGQTALAFSAFIVSGLRIQYSFDNLKWFDATFYKLDYGYDSEENVPGIGATKLNVSEGNWRLHKYFFNSAEDSQLWFRYGFESTQGYPDLDVENNPNNGGPCLDDLTIMQPEIPPEAIWFEDFETGDMSQWEEGEGDIVTFVARTNSTYGPASIDAKSGTYFCGLSKVPYSNNGWRRMTSGPIPVTTGEQYELAFYAAGKTEIYWDGLLVGFSFDGTSWNWLGEDDIAGHDFEGYIGFGSTLDYEWRLFDGVFTASSDVLYIGIGFESDSSVMGYIGPSLDLMSVRPYVPIP
jgi:hypothetical protein